MNPPKTPTQGETQELCEKMREHERVCYGEVYVQKNIDPILSYIQLLAREHKMMREALSFPDGIHITMNFTGCTTPASFMAAIKEAGNDLERQKEQILFSLSK